MKHIKKKKYQQVVFFISLNPNKDIKYDIICEVQIKIFICGSYSLNVA